MVDVVTRVRVALTDAGTPLGKAHVRASARGMVEVTGSYPFALDARVVERAFALLGVQSGERVDFPRPVSGAAPFTQYRGVVDDVTVLAATTLHPVAAEATPLFDGVTKVVW